jgi:opacity protein-like surface antigen
MRTLCLLLLGGATAFSQPISAGIKAGVPFTDFTNAVQSGGFNFTSSTQPYIVGPMIQLRLPFGLGVEFDALYRRFHYTGTSTISTNVVNATTTANAWEFPLVAKYRFHGSLVRPYIEGGVAWDSLQGVSQTIVSTVNSPLLPTVKQKNTIAGFVMGAGLDVKILVLHLAPEIRYTRWGAEHFLDPNGGFSSNRNQAEFLVGFSF